MLICILKVYEFDWHMADIKRKKREILFLFS